MTLQIRRGEEADRTSIVPKEGELLYVTDTNKLYIGDGTQQGGIDISSVGYTGSAGADGSVGYIGSAGADGLVGYTGSAGADGMVGYTGSAGADGVIGYTGSAGADGLVSVTEDVIVLSGSAGSVDHDLNLGSIFYHTNVTSAFDVNITNAPLTQNASTVVVLFIAQGTTAYPINQVLIDSVPQPVKWMGGIFPIQSPSNIDIISFSLIKIGSDWNVLGQSGFYG
jgi:hypothetical protein